MDPVTTAIVSAASAGLAAGGTEAAKQAGADSYRALKDLVARKLGRDSEAVEAIGKLEAKPDSDARRKAVEEEIQDAGAHNDADILAAAERLSEKVKNLAGGDQYHQHAEGQNIAQAQGNSNASVTMNKGK